MVDCHITQVECHQLVCVGQIELSAVLQFGFWVLQFYFHAAGGGRIM